MQRIVEALIDEEGGARHDAAVTIWAYVCCSSSNKRPIFSDPACLRM